MLCRLCNLDSTSTALLPHAGATQEASKVSEFNPAYGVKMETAVDGKYSPVLDELSDGTPDRRGYMPGSPLARPAFLQLGVLTTMDANAPEKGSDNVFDTTRTPLLLSPRAMIDPVGQPTNPDQPRTQTCHRSLPEHTDRSGLA